MKRASHANSERARKKGLAGIISQCSVHNDEHSLHFFFAGPPTLRSARQFSAHKSATLFSPFAHPTRARALCAANVVPEALAPVSRYAEQVALHSLCTGRPWHLAPNAFVI